MDSESLEACATAHQDEMEVFALIAEGQRALRQARAALSKITVGSIGIRMSIPSRFGGQGAPPPPGARPGRASVRALWRTALDVGVL